MGHPVDHVEIEDNDYRTEPEYVAMRAKFEDMALKIFTENVVPTIGERRLRAVRGRPQGPRRPGGQAGTADVGPAPHVDDHRHGRYHLEQERGRPGRRAPMVRLPGISPRRQITKAVQYLDLSDPYFKGSSSGSTRMSTSPPTPSSGSKVNVEYEQQDEQMNRVVRGSRSMLFTSADQVQTFRQILARGSDGATKDEYRYWSEIIYKETGQTIASPPPARCPGRAPSWSSRTARWASSGHVATLACSRRGRLGGSLHLSRGPPRPRRRPEAELSTASPGDILHVCRAQQRTRPVHLPGWTYVLTDGQQMDLPPVTGRAESLTVGSPFESRITATFVAQADFSVVDKIILDATYADESHDLRLTHHAELASNGASDTWSVALRDPAKTGFTYTTLVLYKNGSADSRSPSPARSATKSAVGVGARLGAGGHARPQPRRGPPQRRRPARV